MPNYNYPADFEGTFWNVIDGDYYVSTVGNDVSGDGSPGNPFLTLRRAFELALTGEKIVIGPNEYLTADGTPSAGVNGSLAPCRLAATSNINLFAGGMATLDGILSQPGDRILVWQQSAPVENGIYIAQSGPWVRAEDFNNPQTMVRGALVPVLEGDQYAGTIFQHTTSQTVVVGLTNIIFDPVAASHWGELQGDINDQGDLTTRISDDIAVAVDNLREGVPTEGDTLNKLYNLIQGVVGVSASATDIADRDAQAAGLEDQQNIHVADASADPTVSSGWAIYKYLEAGGAFIKIAEQESIDVQLLNPANGLSENAGTIALGGDLTQNTVINTAGFNLSFNGPGGSIGIDNGSLEVGGSIRTRPGAADPTPAEIGNHHFHVWRNTTDSEISLWANNAGTMENLTSGLRQITENGNTGWVLFGVDRTNYDPIGANAVDISSDDPAVATVNFTNLGASGQYAYAEGNNTIASGFASHAEGADTRASGNQSHAEGNETQATGYDCHSEGRNTIASGDYSHSEGLTTVASGEASHAEGFNTQATGVHSHSEGSGTNAIGDFSHAQGITTRATGIASHSGGSGLRVAPWTDLIASGVASFNHSEIDAAYTGTGAAADNSAILGGVNLEVQATAMRSVALGGQDRSISAPDMVDVPFLIVNNNASITGDLNVSGLTTISNDLDIDSGGSINIDSGVLTVGGSIRYRSAATPPLTTDIVNGFFHLWHNTVDNEISLWANNAGTMENLTSGLRQITENGNTGWSLFGNGRAFKGDIGNNAVDLSMATNGTDRGATGQYAFAEGRDTTALGLYSHAEGQDTIATGLHSHTEGLNTTASGARSHAEGINTTASGIGSHAEGGSTTASGNGGSHAEGAATIASGNSSHAEGQYTTASGDNSHAGGRGSVVTAVEASGQTAFNHSEIDGPYNGTGAAADNSAILGGVNLEVQATALRSVALGGQDRSVSAPDTVDVPNLVVNNAINAASLPTSPAGLAPGDLWIDTTADNTVKVVL